MNNFTEAIKPTCPKCGGSASRPTRMGMSFHDSKCDACGVTFSFGHTLILGSTASGKTASNALMRVGRKSNAKAIQAAHQNRAPYYRHFDKRK